MSGIKYLKEFDKSQLWRFFVDGRFQKKYNGWVGYEAGERGSVQALINGFSFMIDNFDISKGLKATYLRELHKICMLSVETTNLKSSPGDLRYLNSGMPFFAKTTTYEHLVEVFELRKGDGTAMFNSEKWGKPADELSVDEIYKVMNKDGKINYRNWYPTLDKKQIDALEGKLSLHEFYEAKHCVQMMMASKMEEIVERYNNSILKANTEEEKLEAICLVSREMELLHPFPDGNCRTFSCVNLTHLLMFNGFAPAILENPNLDNEVSFEQWIEEVKLGIKRTKQLIKNPNEPLFDYSILDMKEQDRNKFLDMASNLIEKIDNFSEIFLNVKRLKKYTKGSWIRPINDSLTFSGVGTYGTYSKGNIYFTMAIKDWIKDGKNPRNELQKIVSSGIKAVVLDDLNYLKDVGNLPVLYVKDCFEAFKQCSIEVRQEHNPFTLLITGTEGKTGAKVQFHHILNRQIKAHGVLNSANTEIPVLRSLINLSEDDKIEINEVSVGSDEAYRVERTKMVNPNLCFFTNIGPNHMDMHKTIDNIMIAKSSVVEGLREGGKCILNSNIEHYPKLLNAIFSRRPNTPILTYGINKSDNAILLNQSFDSDKFGWNVEANIDGIKVDYFVPMIQQHCALASVGILLGVKEMGFDVIKAANDFADLTPFETMGRVLTIPKKSGDVFFYDQSRRGGMHGMRSAFNDIKNFKIKGKIVALVGGISIKKDTDWTKESHHELAKLINESKIDKLYLTGNFMDYVSNNLENRHILIKHSDDINELANNLYSELKGGDLLFIIGSAYLYLGRVSDLILKMKDNSAFDPVINEYELSSENTILYKIVSSLYEVEKGVKLADALTNNDLSLIDFENIKNKYRSFNHLKSTLLINFFEALNSELTSNHTFTLVNEDIKKSGNESFVCNEDYTLKWFNNVYKESNLPKKQLFGSFYYFGDKDYLLHIEVATMNVHIGFVKYTKENGLYKALKMNENDRNNIENKYKNSFELPQSFEHRSWGLKWYSYDCGNFINITNPHNFVALVDLKSSVFYKTILFPIMQRISNN